MNINSIFPELLLFLFGFFLSGVFVEFLFILFYKSPIPDEKVPGCARFPLIVIICMLFVSAFIALFLFSLDSLVVFFLSLLGAPAGVWSSLHAKKLGYKKLGLFMNVYKPLSFFLGGNRTSGSSKGPHGGGKGSGGGGSSGGGGAGD